MKEYLVGQVLLLGLEEFQSHCPIGLTKARVLFNKFRNNTSETEKRVQFQENETIMSQ